MSGLEGLRSRGVELPPKARSVTVLLIALVIAVCAVLDQHAGTPATKSAPSVVGAAPASAISSAWYCPLVTAADPAASSVTIFNPGSVALAGVATVVVPVGNSVDTPVNVPPRSRGLLTPGAVVQSGWASVVVRLNGGGAAVEETVNDADGAQSTPCSSTASANWYFADGTTEAGATLAIGLLNPFDSDAIVDASFVTDQGQSLPQEFQGVVIPAHTMTVLDVSGSVRRRDWVATTISLRSGNIAAAQLQSGVINGNPALGLTVGAPSTSLNQYLPHMSKSVGRNESLSLYNPNSVESVVEVDPVLSSGTAAPYTFHVPAQGRAQVNFATENRIPQNATFGVVVKVHNGVPIVSQQTVTQTPPPTPSATDAPQGPAGGDFMILSDTPSKTWLIGAAASASTSDEWIYVMNPGTEPATIRLTLVGDGNSAVQPPLRLDAGHTYGLRLNTLSPSASASVVVQSDKGVIASWEIDNLTGPGLSVAPGVGVR